MAEGDEAGGNPEAAGYSFPVVNPRLVPCDPAAVAPDPETPVLWRHDPEATIAKPDKPGDMTNINALLRRLQAAQIAALPDAADVPEAHTAGGRPLVKVGEARTVEEAAAVLGATLCSVCRCRYGLADPCPFCREVAYWDGVERSHIPLGVVVALTVLLMAGIAVFAFFALTWGK